INGLKRYKEKMGRKKYDEVMEIFATGNTAFDQLIQKMVKKAKDVEFLDKLLRDHMIDNLRNDQKEQEEFKEIVDAAREQINHLLPIQHKTSLNETIIHAANFSLESGGKRLRPVMTWVMGIN